MTAQTYELVTNPWAMCGECEEEVSARRGDTNWPCGHVASIVSVCPTWDLFDGCQCRTADEADALQEALEAAGYDVPARSTEPIDDLLLRAANGPSPRLFGYLLLVVALSIVMLIAGQFGAIW